MNQWRGWALPRGVTPPNTTTMRYGSVEVELPLITPAILSQLLDQLVSAQERLSRWPVGRIVEAVDHAVGRWLDQDDEVRRLAEAALPEVTGLSRPMVSRGLDLMLEGYRTPGLLALLEAELGEPEVLDTFRPSHGIMRRAYGPQLTVVICSSNLPAIAAHSLILAILTKSAVLVKSATGEPLFAPLFIRSLAEAEPLLGEVLAAVWWKGGARELEDQVFDRADPVIVYGNDETIRDVQHRVPGRCLTFGHGISLGVIAREALSDLEETAARAATDVALFDQQGCLSPHLFYVETGGPVGPREVAKALATALEAVEVTLPRGRIPPEASSEIQQLRGTIRFRELAGEDVALYASSVGTTWTVIYEADQACIPSCLYRTVRVKPVADLREVPALIHPWRAVLQAVGVAVPDARLGPLADQLSRAGALRICPLGRMQQPALAWHREGRLVFSDLLRWVNLEEDGVRS